MTQLQGFQEYFIDLVGGRTQALAIEAAGVLLLLVLVVFWIRWQFSAETRRARLFRRRFKMLARAHQLGGLDQMLLLDMVRGLEDPCMIFVRRSLFESHSAASGVDAGRLEGLRRRLYS
ncbi:MAG: hypothetical protein HY716_02635 [Planctomycetes bacterium]|nr:hypothetical protein [Planctomycetota bacterium]